VLFLSLGLMAFGWVELYSASALMAETRFGDQYYFLKRQLLWSGLGLAGLLVALRVNLKFLQRHARLIFLGVLILLVLVLVMGQEVGGARRWLRVGGLGIQPSEFAKLAVVLVLADYLDRKQSQLAGWSGFIAPLVALGLVLGLILLEKDLGTPVLIGAAGVGMIYLAGARYRHLALIAALCIPGIYFAILREPYRLRRVLAFLDPWQDARGAGYQLVQSLFAIGSGGFWGRGAGESTIKMHYLPESQTDFIFAILGEELGFVGAAGLTVAFFYLVHRCFRIGMRATNWFDTLLACGVALLLGGQVLLNLGVVTGLLPTKGIPLPFISFGGSSLIVTLFAIGLVLNVSRNEGTPAGHRLKIKKLKYEI
jgi:cell division protein FtsW